ncbi:uncharacterized protein LOC125025017 [Penaeus chinensis]|uniref:uncharacterized protein LOC125025017 n=1 Tax=Penaeus chinensis TaxID=139456 RepID=UPI001FB79CF1|nr:uncharacterized protein LOC125025017 [Penaeus chinensis]XP_047468828.1 uncharacterized protein LOC125025017 [Penaeus chinensis]
MADTVPTQCSKDDGEPGPALATAAPVDQATPGGSQALETQTSSKPPPKMSLEVPVVCITPPSPTPGDSQDKPPAESSPEKPNKVDGDPLQYLSCEVPKTSTKYPAAAKESSLGVVPAIILDPLKHNQEPTVLGDSEESRKEDKEQINVQIKSPLDNCPANHPLTDTERSVGKSDTRAEISTEKAASFESVSDSITACNESSTEKLTSDSVASLKTSDVVGNTTVESIPNSASLTENNTDHGAELSENNTKNISPSSKVQTTPVTSSFSSSVAEENVQGLVSSSSQEQVQAPVSENRASKVPLVVTDRSSSLPTVFSDQQSSKVPAAANQSSGSPLSCPSALADTLQSVSSKEESDSSAVSDCIVSQKAHSSRTVQNSSSECGVEVEQSEVSSERSKEKTADSMPDSISVTEKLKEPLESEDVAKASKLTIKKVDEINDGHEVNTAESPKVWSEQDVTPEVPVETIPVIVNTEDREQEKVGKISEVQGNFVSPVIPSSHSSAIASPDNVSSVDAEQLQPVTIGSSLQPLEEVQEASVSGDPSFAAADLALIDSSADEADSIGGLVINSVIGAADGVADFHPDEMETDRELTDISASAPHTVGENCDNADSSDEIEPSAKRMRFENGADDIEDKLQTSRNVNIKVSPIKNGHGLWDACKLRQILLEKGTIILRLHASVDHMEMNDSDKENKDVDFTGIMVEIKDEDQDHILGLASLEPDADLCDPLAIGLTHNLDHTSPPHYSRGYPHHSRGRSTTLQPAMTRPVFKHLQSPPHSQHYMKQDLLGHPQPLEFEEPQLGTTDWAGMVTHIAESPEPQNSSSLLMEETASSLSPRMEQVRRRVRNVGRVIRMKKVCEHCGMAFNKSHKYMQHLRTHRPLQQCDKCNFKTKDLKRFRNHQISHKKENPEVKCNLCNELFATTTTRRIHKKKIHKVFECKYCCNDYKLEEEMISHMTENHGHIRDRPGYLTAREMKNVKPVNIFVDPPSPGGKSQFVCRLCNKETRNKYQLKIHIAQHLGVSSSKISDDFLVTQDVEQFNRDGGSVSSFGSDDNTADGPKPGHSDYLFPQYMSVKREPGSALEDGFEHRGTSADTPSFVSMRSETSSISSVTYNSDTSPAATMQDLFPLTTNRAEEIDIDDTPLLQKLWLKEEPESWSDSQNTLLNDSSGVRCGVCDIHFLDIEELHNHVLTSHNKLIYRCGQCEQIFPKAEDLFKHTLTEHGKAACRTKPENLVKPSQLELSKIHTVLPENKHTLPAFYCEICRESFKSAKRLRNHEKVKHRKVFTCQACNVTHYQSTKMIRHQKQCHKDMFRCRYFCMALFETEAERSVHHLKVHNKDDTKVTCPYCKVEYQYEGNLMNHLDKCKNCPPDKRPAHVCGNCNIMFPSIEHYNVHIKNCRPCKKDSEKTKAQNEDKRKHKETVCGTSSKEDLIEVDPLQDAAPRNDAIPEVPVNKTKEGMVRPSLGDEDDELEPFDISVIENVPLQLNPVQNKCVNSSPGVKFFKVCEYCGRAFNKKAAYIQHRNSHRPVQQCKKCNFKTKDVKRFKEHVDSHEENKREVQCNMCPMQFSTILSRRNHKKNVHNVYECNHCSIDYISESKLNEHINDSHLPRKGVYVAIENVENGESSSIVSQESFSSSSPKKFLVCRLCNKETRNKYQLKIHLAQHLGVSSSTITDDNLLLEDVEQFAWDEDNEVHNHSENNAVYRNSESEGAGNDSVLSSEVHKEVRLRDSDLDSIQLQGNLIVKEEPIEIDLVEKQHDIEPTRYQAPIIFPRRVGRPMLMLTCDHCSDTFKSPKALRNHQKLKHKRLVKCPACNITRVNTKKMLAHQKTAHKNKFRCHFHCLALFDTRKELSSHHLKIHKKDDSKLVCRYCRQNYPRGTYMNHLKHCEEDPLMRRAPCICSLCEASFSSADELARHAKCCGAENPEPESSKPVGNEIVDVSTDEAEDNVSKSKEEKNVSNKSKPVEKEDVYLNTDVSEDNIPLSKKETVSRKSLQSSILKEKVVIDCTSQAQGNVIIEKVKEAAQDKVGPQRCKYCSKTFDTVDDGINHVLCSHRVLISNITKEPRMCHLCGKNFLSGLALCKHILKHYSDTGLWDSLVPPDLNMETVRSICWICKTKGMVNHRYHATRRDNFIEKLLTTRYIEPDSNDIYHCSACDEGFQSRFAFWKHIKLHMSKAFFKNAEGGKRFKCTRCPLKFLKKSQLYGHIATHLLDPHITQGEEDCVDEGGDERCELDEVSYRTLGGAKNSLAQNKLMVKHAILAGKLSSSQVPQKCKRCRKKFKSLEDAVEHVFTTHKTILGNMMDDTQACHVCDKTFMKPMILCKHLLIHYRELNMLDDLVPRDLLKRTKDRRYCWICNNMLGRKASRHINMRNNVIEKILSNENEELNEEDFPCSLCGDVCTTRYNFWKHIVLHMYKFPKKFKKVSESSSPNSLEASKELRCSDCSLKFNEKTALNKHLATHFLLPYTGQEIEEEKTIPDKKEVILENKDAIPCIEEIIPDKTDEPACKESNPSEKNQASNNTIRLRNKAPKLGDSSDSSQQCTCCSEIFQNTDEAVTHVISLHKSDINQTICQPFKCHMCGTVFKSTWCLCKHLSKHYSNLGMWDALVPHDLLDSYDLRNQCWICKGQLEKNYTDHINKRNVVIEKLLLTKMNQSEDSEDFKCSLCNGFYKGRLTFWRHIQLHLSKAPIKVRGKRVVKPPLNIIDYENQQFSCNECSLYFLDERELYEHLATHFICKYEEMKAIQNVSEDSQSNLSFVEELEPLVQIELPAKRKLGEGEGHKLDAESSRVGDSNQRKKRKIFKTGGDEENEEQENTEWEIEEDTDIEESESECDVESMDEIETDDEVGEETDE